MCVFVCKMYGSTDRWWLYCLGMNWYIKSTGTSGLDNGAGRERAERGNSKSIFECLCQIPEFAAVYIFVAVYLSVCEPENMRNFMALGTGETQKSQKTCSKSIWDSAVEPTTYINRDMKECHLLEQKNDFTKLNLSTQKCECTRIFFNWIRTTYISQLCTLIQILL